MDEKQDSGDIKACGPGRRLLYFRLGCYL